MSTYYNGTTKEELDKYLEENKKLNHTIDKSPLITMLQEATALSDPLECQEPAIDLNTILFRNDCSSSSSDITKKEIDFLICSKCLWCASLYTNMGNSSNVKCPICNNSRNLASMSICENELTTPTPTNHILDSIINHKKGNNKSETITFRIDKAVLDRIRGEAYRHNMSLNSFLNQILTEFTEWNMFRPTSGIPVAKQVVAQIFQKMNKDEIQNLAANSGKDAIEDTYLFMRGNNIDLNSFLKWLEIRMKNCSVDISHIVGDSKQTYIMKHELGENWSLYNKIILEAIFRELFQESFNIEIRNDTVLMLEVQR